MRDTKQAEQIVASLHRHPRVAHQEIVSSEAEQEALRQALPHFVPFGGAEYQGILPLLDWDHKLPSQTAILRLYAYYSASTLLAGEAALAERTEQIAARDTFPEFDVPDFAGILADEAYEATLERGDPHFQIQQVRLVSSWRREIAPEEAHVAVQLARQSDEFRKLSAMVRRRPDYLGDLEAVSWTPPCETSYPEWTIDVWYLTDLNASVGKGRSFLVDIKTKKIVGIREFMVRSS